MEAAEVLKQGLALGNGTHLKNRLVKAAMSEGLGTANNRPTQRLHHLYGTWARGGAGLCITGNVMIDRNAIGEPNGVVVEDDRDLDSLRSWAAAGTAQGTHLWMQISHPGKQAPKGLNRETVAPSAVPFCEDMAAFFAQPRALTEAEIEQLIVRYGRTAAVAQKAGFSGVQIHGAHGYLISAFLSPLHNQRADRWGGGAPQRRRFLLAVLAEVRRQVGADFALGIKLNASDFEADGYSEQAALDTIQAVAESGVDLVEISGGTYQAPAMTGAGFAAENISATEAYFYGFALKARARARVPLMLTGGFRTASGMANAIASGAADLVGLARPVAIEPDLPSRLLQGLSSRHQIRPVRTGLGAIDGRGLMEVAWYARQLRRIADGRSPKLKESGLAAFTAWLIDTGWRTYQSRRQHSKSGGPMP